MIGYVTLGTNDLPRAAAFYDALLAEIGAKRLFDFGRGIAWGVAMDKPSLGLMTPFDGKPATVGNCVMAAIVVDSPEKVDRLYRKAMELGAPREVIRPDTLQRLYGIDVRIVETADGVHTCLPDYATRG